jgi:rhodanese-related sulfurtransferase
MGFFSRLFGGSSIDYKTLVNNGASIIDVRTPGEFASGNIKGSINIPLQELDKKMSKLDKRKPVITCCASGMRSASAKSLLKSKGFEVYNGGGWYSLKSKI